MRDRDLELIAALVEGRLDDESEARALIDSSPDARSEYEAQHRAYDALTGLAPAPMTESERAALHRDVWTALRSESAVVGSATPWYARWIPAAAAVSVLVFVGVVATLDDGDETAVFSEIGRGLADGTTSAAAGENAGDGDGGGDMAPLDAPNTTAGAMSSDGSEVSPEAAQFFSAEAERIRTRQAPITTTGEDSAGQTPVETCLRELGLVDHVVVDTLKPESAYPNVAETVIAAVPEAVAIEEAPVTFVDSATCQIVYIDE